MTRRVSDLSDADLKSELSGHGYQCGPITGTTRRVLERKLEAFRDGKESILTAGRTASKSPGRQPATKKALIEKKSSVSSGGKAAVRPPRTPSPVKAKPQALTAPTGGARKAPPSTYGFSGGGDSTGDSDVEMLHIPPQHPTPPTPAAAAAAARAKKASSSAGTGGAKSISGKSGGGSRSPSPAKKAPTGGRTGSPSSRPVLIPAAAFAAGSGRFRASMTGDDYSMMDSSMNTTASSAVFGGAGRGQRLSAGSTQSQQQRFGGQPQTQNQSNSSISFESSGGFDDDDNDSDQEEEVDDHLESSRVLSDTERSRYRRSLKISPIKPKKAPLSSGGNKKRNSFGEAVTHIGKQAWGYFSRPIGQSTPCSDDKYNKHERDTPTSTYETGGYTLRGNTSGGAGGIGGGGNKYRRSGAAAASSLMDVSVKSGGFGAAAHSRTVLWALGGFLLVLAVGYAVSSQPDAVKSSLGLARDLLKDTTTVLYSYAVLPIATVLLVVFFAGLAWQLWKWHQAGKRECQRRLMTLVEQITDIIQTYQPEGIPEQHVRDMLLPPTKRTTDDYKLWRSAADFINKEDSRVRTEIRLIDGIECQVWLWSAVGGSGGRGRGGSGQGQGSGGWQGSTTGKTMTTNGSGAGGGGGVARRRFF